MDNLTAETKSALETLLGQALVSYKFTKSQPSPFMPVTEIHLANGVEFSYSQVNQARLDIAAAAPRIQGPVEPIKNAPDSYWH